MDALAITDHGTFYGVVDFYSACKEAGIKPIIGCEVYVAHGSRLDKTGAERSPNHLVLLARNNTGYRNLMQLATRSHVEGFHYRPRIDRELLEKHHQGLVALSGCPSAELPRRIADGNMADARAVALWYKELFGDGLLPGAATTRTRAPDLGDQPRIDCPGQGVGPASGGNQRRPLRTTERLSAAGRLHLHPDQHHDKR